MKLLSRSRLFLSAAGLLLCSATLVPAQQVRQAGSSAGTSSAVTVPFFAEDRDGHPLSAIAPSDLFIVDNKVHAQSVLRIRSAKELPLRIGLLIDASGSEGRNELYRPGVQAADDLLYQVLSGADDLVFLVTVRETPDATGFMSRNALAAFKANVTPRGGTALYDAVYLACKERMEAGRGGPARRLLIILSDGGDNASRVSLDQAIAAAQESGTVILAVSTGADQRDSARLQQLAEKTGGRAFLGLERKEIEETFATIREEIENMYAVTYIPADWSPNGKYRSLELKPVPGKPFKLRGPKGYYALAGPR